MVGIALGQRVKTARLGRGMTMAELAEACGLTKGFISQLESGSSNPSLNTLRKIADALQMPVSGLLTIAGSSAQPSSFPAKQQYPAILHDSLLASVQQGLHCLAVGRGGVHALVNLAGGDRVNLTVSGELRKSPAEMVVTVLDGLAQLTQHERSIEVSQGEIASCDAASDYCIEAFAPAGARLLLFIPQGNALPDYEQGRIVRRVDMGAPALSLASIVLGAKRGRRTSARVAIPHRYGGRAMPLRSRSDGPLRLVAMRAERLAERRRQS